MQEYVVRSRLHLIAGALLSSIAPLAFGAGKSIVFASAADVIDSSHGAWLRLIYTEACRRLGYDFELRTYPTRRAAAMSDSGTVDGEINRVSDYGVQRPNLIRVATSHFSMQFGAYGQRALPVGAGWQGLSGRGEWRVEYRSGVVRCQSRLTALIAPSRLSHVSTAALGIRKLAQGRTDIYVDLDSVVDAVLAQPEFADASIRKLAVVETVQMHAFIRNTNPALAIQLASVLAAMHTEGVIEKYRRVAGVGLK